jgi:hypothetical protein
MAVEEGEVVVVNYSDLSLHPERGAPYGSSAYLGLAAADADRYAHHPRLRQRRQPTFSSVAGRGILKAPNEPSSLYRLFPGSAIS